MMLTTDSRAGARHPWLELAAILGSLALALAAERLAPAGTPVVCAYLVPLALAGWQRRGVAGAAVVVAAAWAGPLAPLVIALRVVAFAVIAYAVARLRVHVEGLAFCAYHDALTGLRNRRGPELAAGIEIARARRSGRPLTLAYLDLDDFKSINDTRGHAEGDRLLGLVADALRTTRGSDLAARIGGDEFVLLLPETDERAAEITLERVRTAVTESTQYSGLAVSFTCGMATFESPPDSIAAMLRAVDGMLYEGKRTRKSSVRTAVIVESLHSTMRVRRSALALPH